jgi:hypothetical protein
MSRDSFGSGFLLSFRSPENLACRTQSSESAATLTADTGLRRSVETSREKCGARDQMIAPSVGAFSIVSSVSLNSQISSNPLNRNSFQSLNSNDTHQVLYLDSNS